MTFPIIKTVGDAVSWLLQTLTFPAKRVTVRWAPRLPRPTLSSPLTISLMDTFSLLCPVSFDELDMGNTPLPSSHVNFCHSDGNSPIPTEHEHTTSAITGWYCIIAWDISSLFSKQYCEANVIFPYPSRLIVSSRSSVFRRHCTPFHTHYQIVFRKHLGFDSLNFFLVISSLIPNFTQSYLLLFYMRPLRLYSSSNSLVETRSCIIYYRWTWFTIWRRCIIFQQVIAPLYTFSFLFYVIFMKN